MRLLLSISLFAGSLAWSALASAQSVDDFDEISARLDAEFDTQTKRIDDIYQAVDEAIERAFSGLTKRIEVKWPDGALPERHRWVTYNKSMGSRAIADFESGELIIETRIEPGENLQQLVAEMMDMSASIATATPAELDAQDVLLHEVTKEVAQVTDEPVIPAVTTDTSLTTVLPDTIGAQLKGIAEALDEDFSDVPDLSKLIAANEVSVVVNQVAQKRQMTSSGKSANSPSATKSALNESNDDKVPGTDTETAVAKVPQEELPVENEKPAELIVQKPVPQETSSGAEAAPMPVLTVVEEDGQTRLQLKIEFVNGYQEKLVKQYFDDIKGYANQYDVPVSVIMAIIETESSYNPRAVSPVPAFGLMQLVPKTAGLDAHLFVHGEKKIVSADYLFNEDNNLHLGAAYFHLLTHRYLRKITDPKARFYCAVASYNTGVGNVAKTFTGRKSITAAVATINGMTPEAVYEHLMQNLPAEETRNYLKKVVSRMAKYQQFDA